MAYTPPALKVFIFHGGAQTDAVHALRRRLERDGVQILKDAQGCDVLLACITPGFLGTDAQLQEWKQVVDAAAEKPRGGASIIPLMLMDGDVPDVLNRWQTVPLFEENGYESLMQLLKLHAERIGSLLKPSATWRKPFQAVMEPVVEETESPEPAISPRMFLAGVGILLLLIILFKGISAWVQYVPVDEMSQNSTESAYNLSANRAMTQTAVALIVLAPRTQTAAAIETQQHPPTPTLQFPTIVALPTEIMAAGNVKMMYVPGDNVLLGNAGDDTGTNPLHAIYVNPFYIDKYEVTNVLYRLCVDTGVCQPPGKVSSETHAEYYGNVEFDQYPVLNVDWAMARRYCEWRGARLPTEAEWEMAARSVDGRIYPWGDSAPDCTLANYAESGVGCVGDAVQVGGYEGGRSLYGVFDMAGNASEWVNSLFWTYPYTSADGRENPQLEGLRVVRGGSWASPAGEVTTFDRQSVDPSRYSPEIGFRCARNAGL